MVEVFFLAVALSMDAFAVSIGLGTKSNKSKTLALMAGAYFGIFQAIMPLIGYWVGKSVLGWMDALAPWVAFFLLVLVGGKMIYEAFSDSTEEALAKVTHRVMLLLAIATSIDAMAAGFALNLLSAGPIVACLAIGVTTFAFSAVGVFLGVKSGSRLGSKAELLGGAGLILIGFKLLLT